MLVALVTAILLAAGSPQASERSRAEDLARSGRSAEALEIFKVVAPKFDVVTTWEHQWRSNDTAVDRVTIALVRFFR
jgi:hypothetical protein